MPIICKCCEGKLWGGWYNSDRTDITVCTNSFEYKDLADVIYHELVHANQHCFGKNWGPGCEKKFMIEIEAYYCMGRCGKDTNFTTPKERALDCIRRAIGSVCRDSANHCPKASMITPELVSALVSWFTTTEKTEMCKFVSVQNSDDGSAEIPYPADY